MNDRIVLDMNVGEALFVLDAVTKAATEAHRVRRYLIATGAPADERSIAETSAAAFDRLELRLRNLLYPACGWWQGECDRPVVEDGLCRYHADQRAGSPVFAA